MRLRSASAPNLLFDWNNLEKELALQDLEMGSGIDFSAGVGVGVDNDKDVDANKNEKLLRFLRRPMKTSSLEASRRLGRLVNVGIVVNVDVDVDEEPVSRFIKSLTFN